MNNKVFTTIIALTFVALFSLTNISKAATYEQQLKPYKDLQDVSNDDIDDLLHTNPSSEDQIARYCDDKLQYLTRFFMCLYKGEDPAPYVLVNNFDAKLWQILQTTNTGILISTPTNTANNAVIMVEGKFNAFDGQQFSNKHYLLKYVGTFQYTNTLGATKTVPKLKLLKELK
ncbi:hypothetical protein ACFX5K_01765 [Rickettsiales bacterium LUAb2]